MSTTQRPLQPFMPITGRLRDYFGASLFTITLRAGRFRCIYFLFRGHCENVERATVDLVEVLCLRVENKDKITL